jgi:hypothetical protein
MSVIVTATILICFALTMTFAFVFRRLAAAGNDLPLESDWIDQINPDRYRPMERLLNGRDYELLEAHPAFDRKMLRQFRSRRIQAFHGYLDCLSVDFGRICAAIGALMVVSAHDRADLARLMVRQRVAFTLRLMLTEARLSLHAAGIGTVDVRGLLASLNSMRVELNSLILAAQPAAC